MQSDMHLRFESEKSTDTVKCKCCVNEKVIKHLKIQVLKVLIF